MPFHDEQIPFEFGNHTDIGRVRKANEDYLGYFNTVNGHIFVVCDGMGGHLGGATAAQAAVDSIRTFFDHRPYDYPREALKQALMYANGQIYAAAQQNTQLWGMGTTCVVVLFRKEELYYAHIGDSRIYRLSAGRLERLTRDHSYVQQLVDQGVITEQEAENHPRRNELTRALGTGREVQVDACDQPLRPRPDDLFMLCTDGLTGTLSDEDIRLELMGKSSIQQRAMRLVEKANEAGGYDNITVQIIQCKAAAQPVIPPPVTPKPVIENTVINKPVTDQSIFEQPVNDPFITQKPTPPEPVLSTSQPVFEKPKTAPPIPATPLPPPTTSPQMPRKAAARKGPDIPLIVLGALALIVVILFISGSKYMSDDPVENSELTTGRLDSTAVTDEEEVTEDESARRSTASSTAAKKTGKTEKSTSEASGGTTITHTVKTGETFNSIARRFNIKLETLKQLNPGVKEGEIKSDVTKLKVKVKAIHTVGPGDVLNVVSRKYNVSKELIMAANGKTQDRADRGETLYIPFAEKQ